MERNKNSFLGKQQCTTSYCNRKNQNSFSNLIVGANIKHPNKQNFPHKKKEWILTIFCRKKHWEKLSYH
jgi:hypothetical protein